MSTLSKNELVYLMAYADGEVDADEMPEVEALIAKSEEAQQIMIQQAALREWVVRQGEQHATEARADRIADAVMAGVEELGGAKVITLERGRAKRELNRQRSKEFGALAAIAAAVALFWFWPSQQEAPVAQIQKETQPAVPAVSAPSVSESASSDPTAPSSAEAVANAEGEVPGIDIQAVESPQHQFSIFYVPAATGANAHASSVVVWIGEE
jgi:anti-sigma factor RsiW